MVLAGARKIAPKDWKSGDCAWLIDVVAPFGDADKIVHQLKTQIFPKTALKTMKPKSDGSGYEVVEITSAVGSNPRGVDNEAERG